MTLAMLISVFTVPVSAAYENTHVNTGNQAYDIFCVAFTQVGYAEGNNNKTKYGEWYPMNYNPWCAMFVSWCAEQAGIPTSVIPKHASCDVGVNWFKNKGRWYNSPYHGGTYTPVMGDIIYFGVVGDSDHVGIVHSVSGGRVYTIEGNASDMCMAKNYDVGSSKILGYGHPAYTDTSVKVPDNNVNTYKGTIVTTGVQSTSVDASLSGEIIGGGASASALTAAFDGNTATVSTLTENSGEAVDYWMGLKLSSAVVPTAFRISVSPHYRIFGSYIQGSNDGVNWTTLKDLSDWRDYATPAEGGNWPAEDVYKTITVSTSTAYRYYRYFNYNGTGGNSLAEFQVFGPSGIVVHKHTMSYIAAKAATCTTAGNRAANYCSGCGNYYADAGGATKLDTITIDALGHSMTYVAAKTGTCTTAGTRAAMYCSRCNAYYADMGGTQKLTTIATALNPDNHTGGTELRNASEATEAEDGYTGDTCCVGCGTVLEAGEVIPALGLPYLLGDIDGDGTVDVYDARELFRHSMLPEVYGIDYAGTLDFTGDGAVDLRDARRLFQYSMLPDVYPIA